MNKETAANIAKSLEKLSKAMEEASKVFNAAFVKTSNSAGSALPKCPELPPFGTRVDLFLESIRDLKKSTQEVLDKPKTHIVHGVEIPDLRFKPKYGQSYWTPAPSIDALVWGTIRVYESSIDTHRVVNNLCYEDSEEGKQAAILHAKAMLGIADKAEKKTEQGEVAYIKWTLGCVESGVKEIRSVTIDRQPVGHLNRATGIEYKTLSDCYMLNIQIRDVF